MNIPIELGLESLYTKAHEVQYRKLAMVLNNINNYSNVEKMAVVQVQSSHIQIFLCDSKIYAWSRHLIKSRNLKKFQKFISEMLNKKGEYC